MILEYLWTDLLILLHLYLMDALLAETDGLELEKLTRTSESSLVRSRPHEKVRVVASHTSMGNSEFIQ